MRFMMLMIPADCVLAAPDAMHHIMTGHWSPCYWSPFRARQKRFSFRSSRRWGPAHHRARDAASGRWAIARRIAALLTTTLVGLAVETALSR
jgi:hypothetical protein